MNGPHRVAGAREVVGDEDLHRRRDVEAVERAPDARRALLEQRPELGDVLGGEERRDPAVGDLAGQARVVGADGGQVDRDRLLHRRDRELQRLAGPVGQRQLERLAVELQALARQRLAHDGDVLARALDLASEALAVPALGDLRARGADAEDHPPVGELVERRGRHRRHRRRAPGHLEDGRARSGSSSSARRSSRGSSPRRSRRPRPSRRCRSPAARPPGRSRAGPRG